MSRSGKFHFQIKTLIASDEWNLIGPIISETPVIYRNDLLNMLAVGFKLNEAFHTLKETYNF